MFMRKKLSCPSCVGIHCRESRWLSLEEKKANPESSPYRCMDCSHRFLARKGASAGREVVIPVRGVMAAIGLMAIVVFGLVSVGGSSAPPPTALPKVIDPGVLQAAEKGDAAAQFRVGEALFHDPVRDGDKSAKAVRWLQLAADNGNTEAMVLLGRLSRSGVGILQDFGQSAKWIQTAAGRGDLEGMLELGRLYRDGIGVDKDLVQAYVWFNRAAAAHNLDAAREREAVARLLTPEELKVAQSQSATVKTSRSGATGEPAIK